MLYVVGLGWRVCCDCDCALLGLGWKGRNVWVACGEGRRGMSNDKDAVWSGKDRFHLISVL